MDAAGMNPYLGEKWHYQFMDRHPPVKKLFFRKVDSKRIKNYNSDAIHSFFEQYEAIIKHRKIKPNNTWNMDESGLQMDETGREVVVSDASNPENTTSVKEPGLER